MPKTKYAHRVVKDGATVWSGDFDDASSKNFPSEWKDRPKGVETGWELHIDDELVGSQVSLAEEAASMAAAQEAAGLEAQS